MPGIRLELANPAAYESPQQYIERHLAPVLSELHRLANEFCTPGSTSEAIDADMTPDPHHYSDQWQRFTHHLDSAPKHVIFDGSEYFSFPKELLRAKQVKVQLVAQVYVKGSGKAHFRLTRSDDSVVGGSSFTIEGPVLQTVTKTLFFGDTRGSISPDSQTYYIEAAGYSARDLPVCRRFSLSFIFI